MSAKMVTRYQLWCYYETADVWKMEGFYETIDGAYAALHLLRDDVDTPCMPTWEVVEVRALYP